MERRVDGELAGTKSVAVAVAALAVPIMVLVVGSYYTNAMKEREVSGKFVELAEQSFPKSRQRLIPIRESEPGQH